MTTEILRTTPRRLAVNYYPSPAQLAFHQDRGRVRERALLAGTGGGKTYSAAYECFEITLKEPPSVVVAAAPDYPQLEQSIYATLRRLFGVHDLHALEPWAKFNESKKTLQWWNGWEWRFASMDDPTSVEGIPEASVVWLTEGRLVRNFDGPDGAWLNLTRRLRGQAARARHAIMDTHSATRGIMETFTPRSITKHQVPGPTGDVGTFRVVDCMDPDRRAYKWGTRDAIAWGTLNRVDGERIIRAYTGAAAARILEGDYAMAEGLVYDAFDEARHLREPTTRIEYLFGGIDWGFDVTAIVLLGGTGSRKWILREKRLENAKLPQVAAALQELDPRGEATWWGGHDRPDSAKELREDYGLDVRPLSGGSVEDGIALVQSALHADELFVAPGCRDVREGFMSHTRDKDTGKPDKQAFDPHFPDAVRYALKGDSAVVHGGVLW